MNEIYFDNSATTQVCESALQAAVKAMREEYGNPSSVHFRGAAAFHALNEARESVAHVLGAMPEEVTFTSCGTEANNTVIFGAAAAGGKQGKRVLVSAVEHPSVSEAAKHLLQSGYDVQFIPVDDAGCVRLDALELLLNEETVLVSVMQVNNEIGTVQPLREVGSLVRRLAPRALFHIDGVQAFARLPIELAGWQADAYSASGHKIHGPKGSGLLWLRTGCHIPALLYGGGQEKKLRSGTENMPGICAFGAAAREASADLSGHARQMLTVKRALAEGAMAEIPDVLMNGQPLDMAAPHILSLSFLGVRSEVLLHYLEQQGICVSAGSACDSRSSKGSHVLLRMGLSPERVDSVLRFSFCRYNTVEEAKRTVAVLKDAVAEIRMMMGRKKTRR